MTNQADTATDPRHMPDPRHLVDHGPMSKFQILVIALCTILVALDGFDVLAISFAAPGIAAEWGISRGALGVVLSMELIGMAFGSIILGNVADRYGRRPTILACLFAMGVGMYLASTAQDVVTLSAYRFFTGLGIGGILSAANAMGAEYASLKRRALAVIIISTGYPVGAILGGSITAELLTHFSWRSVFVLGAIATAIFWPIVYFFMPESIDYLVEKKPTSALSKTNVVLKRMGRSTINALPISKDTTIKSGFGSLFTKKFAAATILLTLAYFCHILTFYYILKWTPKIIVDMGFAANLAGSVLVWANIGGAVGSVLLGLLSMKFNVHPLVIGACFIGAIMVFIFGRGYENLTQLSMICAAAGFFINAAIVGLYAMVVTYYPTELRATGTGFIIGFGRGGAALGPILAGFLFSSGQGLQTVSIVMGCGALLAAIALSVFYVVQKQTKITS